MDKLPPGITQADVEGFMQLTQANQPSAPVANQAKLPPGITQADVEGFIQLSQANQPVAPAPVQTPVAPRIVGPVDTSMNRRESLNNQSAGINYTQDDIDLQMYNGLMNAAKNGATSQADYWNQFNPAQKARVGKLLAGAYAQAPDQDKGIISNIITGLGNSARDTLDATGQIINYATGDKEKIAAKNLEIQRNKANEEIRDAMNPSTVRDVSKVGGDVAQFFIPGVGEAATIVGKGGAALLAKAPIIGKAVEVAPNLTNYAIQGAGVSVLQNPATGNPENFVSEKLGQAGAGAVAGGVGGVVAEKTIGYLGGKIDKFKQVRDTPLSPEAQAFEADAQRAGIRTFASDSPDASNTMVKRSQLSTFKNEKMSKEVQGQQSDVNKAFENFKSDLPSADPSKILDETGLNKVLADTNSPYHYSAKEIEAKIANVSLDDPNAILKVSGEAQNLANKAEGRGLYDKAESLVPEGTVVPLNEAEKVLTNAKSFMNDLSTPSQKGKFKSVIEDLEGTIEKAKSGKNAYADINKYFREMGDNARAAISSGDAQSARFYNEFKSALNADKDAYMNSLADSSEVRAYKQAYAEATNFNRQKIQGIKTNSLDTIFEPYNKKGSPNLPDGLIEKWVKKGQTSKVQAIYDNLPETGKNAVQQGVMNKIIGNATSKEGDIIPSKLVANYKAYKDPSSGNTPLDVILNPSSKQALDNLVRVLDNLKNISYNKANPLTGVQNEAAILNSSGVLGHLKAISGYMKTKLFVEGLTNKKFQRMLININNINPSRPAYAERVGELATYMSSSLNNNKDK